MALKEEEKKVVGPDIMAGARKKLATRSVPGMYEQGNPLVDAQSNMENAALQIGKGALQGTKNIANAAATVTGAKPYINLAGNVASGLAGDFQDRRTNAKAVAASRPQSALGKLDLLNQGVREKQMGVQKNPAPFNGVLPQIGAQPKLGPNPFNKPLGYGGQPTPSPAAPVAQKPVVAQTARQRIAGAPKQDIINGVRQSDGVVIAPNGMEILNGNPRDNLAESRVDTRITPATDLRGFSIPGQFNTETLTFGNPSAVDKANIAKSNAGLAGMGLDDQIKKAELSQKQRVQALQDRLLDDNTTPEDAAKIKAKLKLIGAVGKEEEPTIVTNRDTDAEGNPIQSSYVVNPSDPANSVRIGAPPNPKQVFMTEIETDEKRKKEWEKLTPEAQESVYQNYLKAISK